jgi:3'-phosphoadenosine 5'-phosphosulfate sulfotransferase (PAPS reductase)/FAD synthetase
LIDAIRGSVDGGVEGETAMTSRSVLQLEYRLSQLDAPEAESIHVFREMTAELERPVLLSSGDKESIVMLRLAEKVFWLARIPFPVPFGGAHRDEDKALAKERVLSFRDDFGQWDPKNQRPELWSLYVTWSGSCSCPRLSRRGSPPGRSLRHEPVARQACSLATTSRRST